jgi:hypothetical protein
LSRTRLRANYFWFLFLIILSMLAELSGPATAQPLGFHGGGRRHGGTETQDRLGYNPQTVTTVKGQVENLGSYGMTGWRVASGMQTQATQVCQQTRLYPAPRGYLGGNRL